MDTSLNNLDSNQAKPLSLQIPNTAFADTLAKNNNSKNENRPTENDVDEDLIDEMIFHYTDNLIEQYHYLYKNRMPLLIKPLNEYGMPKLVCTTIKPTIMRNKILLNYRETAEFVSDFINYKKLPTFNQLPTILISPKELLKTRIGNCFEMSTLLVSLLVGIGYDAYVVCGYASREVCNGDLSFDKFNDTHLFKNENECLINDIGQNYQSISKIESKPNKCLFVIRDKFESKYDKRMNILNKTNINKKVEDDDSSLSSTAPDDPLAGLRIHSWVLCRAGKRLTQETFFIEASTGECKTLNDKNYHGIESIWNNQNYWINFQDCTDGCENLSFDLDDENYWEKVFFQSNFSSNKRRLSNGSMIDFQNYRDNVDEVATKGTNTIRRDSNDVDDIDMDEIFNSIWLPQSWVGDLQLSRTDVIKKYPDSQKTLIYYKTLIKKYAPFTHKKGCVLKVLKFKDFKMKNLVKTLYKFEYRVDLLDQRILDNTKNLVTDFFHFGRKYGLYAHQYKSHSRNKPEHKRTMLFNPQLRNDNLIRRDEDHNRIEEYYLNRFDNLAYRKVSFEKHARTLSTTLSSITIADNFSLEAPPTFVSSQTSRENFKDFMKNYRKPIKKRFRRERSRREIEAIIERYTRNPSIQYDNDIEEIIYDLKNSTISVKFHRDPNFITSTFHEFTKPVEYEDFETSSNKFDWDTASHKSFYANPDKRTDDIYHLNNLLFMLIQREKQACDHVRKVEAEIKDILKQLAHDDTTNELKTNLIYLADLNADSNQDTKKLAQDNNDQEPTDTYFCNLNKFSSSEIKQKHLNDLCNTYTKRINLVQKKFDNEKILLANQLKSYDLNKYNINNDESELNISNNIENHRFNVELLNNRIKVIKLEAEDQYKLLENSLESNKN